MVAFKRRGAVWGEAGMKPLPGYVGEKYDRIDYAIRCKITGKYFRVL